MSEKHGFSIDQLMELAGLSVSNTIYKCFPKEKYPSILVICGPGNNGGDGLVAARHLSHFGYQPTILYPKKTSNNLYLRLMSQCKNLQIPIIEQLPNNFEKEFDQILDSIFGFSFKGNVRPPFDEIIKQVSKSNLPITSVDVPSGWNVEEGPKDGCIKNPDGDISLEVDSYQLK
eukprot:gene2257-2431_t